MKLLQNRKFAWAVLAVCVLGSVIGLGGYSLASQRSDVMYVFNEGVDTSYAVRFSMDAYLDNCADYALIMAEEYRLQVDSEDETAATVIELANQVAQEEDLSAREDAYESLRTAVEALYTNFAAANVSDDDAFMDAYTNFQDEVVKLGYDGYHALAEEFNRSCEGFPAGAVCALLGIDELETF